MKFIKKLWNQYQERKLLAVVDSLFAVKHHDVSAADHEDVHITPCPDSTPFTTSHPDNAYHRNGGPGRYSTENRVIIGSDYYLYDKDGNKYLAYTTEQVKCFDT